MECGICYEPFGTGDKRQIRTSCGHSFCKECHESSFFHSNKRKIECPLCSKELSRDVQLDLSSEIHHLQRDRDFQHFIQQEKYRMQGENEHAAWYRQCQAFADDMERTFEGKVLYSEYQYQKMSIGNNVISMRKVYTTIRFDIPAEERLLLKEALDASRHEFATMCRFQSSSEPPSSSSTKMSLRCPEENCRGYVTVQKPEEEEKDDDDDTPSSSTSYVCLLCKISRCRLCFEKIEGNHSCLEDKQASFQTIMRDSKPCPQCKELIFKVNGCDQMFCTMCHCVFSWSTLKEDYGKIHNPEYKDMITRVLKLPEQPVVDIDHFSRILPEIGGYGSRHVPKKSSSSFYSFFIKMTQTIMLLEEYCRKAVSLQGPIKFQAIMQRYRIFYMTHIYPTETVWQQRVYSQWVKRRNMTQRVDEIHKLHRMIQFVIEEVNTSPPLRYLQWRETYYNSLAMFRSSWENTQRCFSQLGIQWNTIGVFQEWNAFFTFHHTIISTVSSNPLLESEDLLWIGECGSRYTGGTRNNVYHGKGRLTGLYSALEIYEGEFKDHVLHGYCTITRDQCQYRGYYDDGKKHGPGCFRLAETEMEMITTRSAHVLPKPPYFVCFDHNRLRWMVFPREEEKNMDHASLSLLINFLFTRGIFFSASSYGEHIVRDVTNEGILYEVDSYSATLPPIEKNKMVLLWEQEHGTPEEEEEFPFITVSFLPITGIRDEMICHKGYRMGGDFVDGCLQRGFIDYGTTEEDVVVYRGAVCKNPHYREYFLETVLRHGKGTMLIKNSQEKAEVEGVYVNNVMADNAVCTITYENRDHPRLSFHFKGSFKKGIQTFHDGSVFEGEFDASSSSTTGRIILRKGTMRFSNGDILEGDMNMKGTCHYYSHQTRKKTLCCCKMEFSRTYLRMYRREKGRYLRLITWEPFTD